MRQPMGRERSIAALGNCKLAVWGFLQREGDAMYPVLLSSLDACRSAHRRARRGRPRTSGRAGLHPREFLLDRTHRWTSHSCP